MTYRRIDPAADFDDVRGLPGGRAAAALASSKLRSWYDIEHNTDTGERYIVWIRTWGDITEGEIKVYQVPDHVSEADASYHIRRALRMFVYYRTHASELKITLLGEEGGRLPRNIEKKIAASL